MKQFYNIFSNEKVSHFATQLSWSHYAELLPLKNIDEIKYYINICRKRNIERNLLREKIHNNEYSRISLSIEVGKKYNRRTLFCLVKEKCPHCGHN